MIHEWLQKLTEVIGSNLWLAPLFALIAGIVTSLTPCSLSSVPLIINYVGGYAENSVKRAFRFSVMFCLGMTITFSLLGAAASLVGSLLKDAGAWWFLVLGLIMALMALQTWDVINIIPHSHAAGNSKRKGYLGALLTGMLGGIIASHCAVPVLFVLLAIAAKVGSTVYGILLLLAYSFGHSVLLVVAGTSVGFVHKISASPKYEKFFKVYKAVMGTLIMFIGMYMFYLGFQEGVN